LSPAGARGVARLQQFRYAGKLRRDQGKSGTLFRPGPGAETSVRDMAPRILYVVTEDWYLLSHRLPMARAAKAAGYEVHVATRACGSARPPAQLSRRSSHAIGQETVALYDQVIGR
jgi:hypothetical protein